jgi:LacI family transcriptional regulator
VPGTRKVTLTDVAAMAGVSTTTASYILNGRSTQMRISPETMRRVQAAVDALGYRPNHTARSLRTATSSTIGVVSDYVASGMFSSAMLSGANAAARAADHLLVIGESEGDLGVRDRLIEEMLSRRVDGIVYATRTTLEIELPAKLRETRTVLLNCIATDHPGPVVLPDDLGGGRTAARALLSAGIDSDVYMVGEDPTPGAIAGDLRLRGAREELESAGSSLSGVIACEWEVGHARRAVDAWLRSGNRPRGLVCMNDRVALGAYEALAGHGVPVPDEVSVVSFDGSDLATWLSPALTSVALPFREMGALAVELLLHRSRGEKAIHRLTMPLLMGDSVEARKVGDA